MAIYFLDTSVVVRRYDRAEPGSRRVRDFYRTEAGHILLISRITSIEVASALNRKLREGRLTAAGRDRAWRLFGQHRRNRYGLVTPDEATWLRAERLLFDHQLRVYDAAQVAFALATRELFGNLATDFRFATADHNQATAANREGLAVELVS